MSIGVEAWKTIPASFLNFFHIFSLILVKVCECSPQSKRRQERYGAKQNLLPFLAIPTLDIIELSLFFLMGVWALYGK